MPNFAHYRAKKESSFLPFPVGRRIARSNSLRHASIGTLINATWSFAIASFDSSLCEADHIAGASGKGWQNPQYPIAK